MLNEERKRRILELVNTQGSISVNEIMKEIYASESTVRRALNDMDESGLLKKVHGGAIALNNDIQTKDISMTRRKDINSKEKNEIARYGASLIKDDDVVYLDAGTNTYMMIPYLKEKKATFVTNGVSHALALSLDGHHVYLPGGTLKKETEALIGQSAAEFIGSMNFTMGFFGTNGITLTEGFTTPDIEEAQIKRKAFNRCRERYVLSDSSKFGNVCSATFAEFDKAIIITSSKAPEKFSREPNTLLVDKV